MRKDLYNEAIVVGYENEGGHRFEQEKPLKPNRLDDLHKDYEWLKYKIATLEGNHGDFRKVFDKEQEQTRKELQLLARWNVFLSLAVVLLLASRLWP